MEQTNKKKKKYLRDVSDYKNNSVFRRQTKKISGAIVKQGGEGRTRDLNCQTQVGLPGTPHLPGLGNYGPNYPQSPCSQPKEGFRGRVVQSLPILIPLLPLAGSIHWVVENFPGEERYITDNPSNWVPQYNQQEDYSPRVPLGTNYWHQQNHLSESNHTGRGGSFNGNFNNNLFFLGPKSEKKHRSKRGSRGGRWICSKKKAVRKILAFLN